MAPTRSRPSPRRRTDRLAASGTACRLTANIRHGHWPDPVTSVLREWTHLCRLRTCSGSAGWAAARPFPIAGLAGMVEHVEPMSASGHVDDLYRCLIPPGSLDERFDCGCDPRVLAPHPGQHDRQVTSGGDGLGRPEPRVDIPPGQGGKDRVGRCHAAQPAWWRNCASRRSETPREQMITFVSTARGRGRWPTDQGFRRARCGLGPGA